MGMKRTGNVANLGNMKCVDNSGRKILDETKYGRYV
jgi:hypothetical protein